MRLHSAIALFPCALLLAGCAAVPVMTTTTSTPANQVQGTALHGRVHGGQQPITGAQVYLYAADATGYGKESDSLLTTPVTTDSNGNFSITGDYTCSSASTQVYLYAVGGDPTPGVPNSTAGLLAGLGSCGSLSSSTYIVVNEVSTIATAFAIAGYATDATHVSSSGSPLAVTGVANAFATVANLETLSTGVALTTTPSTYGTVPQSEINTLANILAACINSTGPTSTACTTLLGSALSDGTTGTTPTDSATAAINIAHNPWANISALYGLQTSNSPFQPMLSAAPNDFTLGVNFTSPGSSGLYGPNKVAVDSSGNVWATADGNGSFPEGGVFELLANGSWSSFTPVTGGGIGYDDPGPIAVDQVTDDIWVMANEVPDYGSTYIGLTPSGSLLSLDTSDGEYDGGLEESYSLAIGSSGYVFATSEEDYEGVNYLYVFNNPDFGYFDGGGLTDGLSVAIDAADNKWVLNENYPDINLVEWNATGTAYSGSPYAGFSATTIACCIAIDASNNVWAANYSDIFEFNSSGTLQSPTGGFSGGGIDGVEAIAIDGAGNVWTANSANASISEISPTFTAISGSNGYTAGGTLNTPFGLAIDGSGNVWVAGNVSNNLVEVVGAATPVVTPIDANLVSPYGTYTVNKP